MHKKNKILFVFICFTSCLFAQLQIKNYFSFTGKKDIPCNTIIQNKNGLLWVGTKEGVFLFDGKTATQIVKKGPLFKKEISALFIDNNENLWIGTKQGKVYIFKNNKTDSIIFPEPNDFNITSICQVDSVVCIATYGNGVFLYNNKKITHLALSNGLSDNVVYKLTTDGKSTLWCATDAGITQINNCSNKPKTLVISNKNGLPDNIVRDIVFTPNKLLISMQDSGTCTYDLDKLNFKKEVFFANWINSPIINANYTNVNTLIVAAEKGGFYYFESGKISVYNYQKYIQQLKINQLFVDNAKQIWVASNKGISQFYERRYDFINMQKGLMDDKILALVADNENNIWIGTQNGISTIAIDKENNLTITKVIEATKYTVSCAIKHTNGNIWFGTYGNGISIINPQTKKITQLKNQLPNLTISNICFAENNIVYISTLGGGLIKAKIDENDNLTIIKTYTEEDGLGSDYVYATILDNANTLYVASDGGGLQILLKNKFFSITKKYKLNSNTVTSLCKDNNNAIWATTNNEGIIKYNGKKVTIFNYANGLRDERPQQIIAKENSVYAINSKGIDKINCNTNKISYYDVFEGDLEPNLNAVYLNNNKIYSGTENGVLIFRTNTEPTDSIKPIVYIKNLQVNYKAYPIDSCSDFSYKQNNLAFTFDGVWLKNPEKLNYRYRLIGFDNDWIFSNEGKLINYNNLTPQSYTFEVQAKNEEDVWSESKKFEFTIQTPIWKKWWFWLIIITIVSFAITSFFKQRLKKLQKENLILEDKVLTRTQEIEKQSQIISEANKELEQLSIVAAQTDNVVLILKPNGDIEYVNESFQRLNRITLDEILTQKLNIFTSSNNPKIKQIVQEAIETKRSVKYESFNDKNPLNQVWEASTLTPIFDENQQVKKIIIIDSDISTSKQQQKIIEQKNKDITDSILYARKIQHAILPENSLILKHIPNAFLLYMTKDIVSGDFYWFTHIDGCSIIAAIDCTGHGVPGAFMSLIGYSILNKIVNEQKITNPKDILFELNNGVLQTLYKNESESKDGMDIAICKINHSKNTLEYAGAMRPLWIVNTADEKTPILTEIKADKIPIGTKQQDRTDLIQYTTHTIQLNTNDSFYIFTDGYADQFGGDKEKKYSTSKLKQIILQNSTLTFDKQQQALKNEHLLWKKNNEQVDDILVIGFKI